MSEERVLLLIPHPDDEVVGAAAAIGRLRNAGGHVFGLYLTTGVPASAGSWFGGRMRYAPSVTRRWNEALEVASVLDLSIAGRQMIPARNLKAHLDTTLDWIRGQAAILEPDRIWTPAYEGGHQDHDVANFLGSRLSDEFEVWEFSEYNFAGGVARSQSFIEANGSESKLVLDADEKADKRAMLDRYASEQQNLDTIRLDQEVLRPLATYDYTRPPHNGMLFYERHQWVPFHPRIDYCRSRQVCDALFEASRSAPSSDRNACVE